MAPTASCVLVRYGDLTDPSSKMFANYKIPQDHRIISLIRGLSEDSFLFFGVSSDANDAELEEFFISDNGEGWSYQTTSDLLEACRDPEIKEVFLVHYYC